MFVVMISFPPVRTGKDAEFRAWFAATNQMFATAKGFIGRKLLRPVEGGNYAALVEFADQAAFQALHTSPAHEQAGAQVKPLLDGKPTPRFYEVIPG